MYILDPYFNEVLNSLHALMTVRTAHIVLKIALLLGLYLQILEIVVLM